MKDKNCLRCGSKLIKFGSNISCSNIYCQNNISDDTEGIYVKHFKYEPDIDLESFLNDISDEEDYDKYLYFSDNPNYVSRLEFQKMNNFIEDKIFKGNKIDKLKNFLKRNEVKNFEDIEKKYEYLKKGRSLEYESHQQALKFYKSLRKNKLFKNDYYLFKKLVIFEKDLKKQLDYIVLFFKSGIYCNRYHYLFFLRKLNDISQKIYVSDELIDDCLRTFKNYGFKKKKYQDVPVPIAEKIKMKFGELKISTDEGYSLMQFKYEMFEEASNLFNKKQYEGSIKILESLIFDKGFKDYNIFNAIRRSYHRLGDNENELKWIFGYFVKGFKINSKSYWDFIEKLDALNIKTNKFSHNELFFDTNEYYLSKQDFKDNPIEYRDLHDYINLIKFKYSMIKKGRKLEITDIDEAIEYYESIIDHKLFENDYHVYKQLASCYHQKDDLENELEIILSFFNSGIYCDYYHYLFFLFNLKKLSQIFVVEDYEINDALKSFKETSFKNKHLENTPAPLADKINFRKNELKIIPDAEFKNNYELNALYLKMDLFESCGMFNSVNEILKTLIKNHDFNDADLYKQICYNYQELNDVESELVIIKSYLETDGGWNFQERKWFENRLHELENNKTTQKPLKEPNFEIFYESNEYYLTYDDFISNDNELTELIDKLNLKLSLRMKGFALEDINYKKAIDYYNSLLNHYLFKDDYYIYRKLVIFYGKINEFKLMWKTIKSFFNSGINCSRYQYIWFLHKLSDISNFMFISNDEVNECLKNFKEHGFQNKNMEKDVFLSERLYKHYDMKVVDQDFYNRTQKKYELTEQVRQLELNGDEKEAVKILQDLVDNGCKTSKKDYMRLCYMYRRLGNYEKELEVINKYLSVPNKSSREFFEKRLNYINNFIIK